MLDYCLLSLFLFFVLLYMINNDYFTNTKDKEIITPLKI